ncbi:MAG: hypothetical protein OXU61_00025 [Gammaproteobacteria bacterium]|nr:hypothetical protein [Gammaproteobacteria bacterium]
MPLFPIVYRAPCSGQRRCLASPARSRPRNRGGFLCPGAAAPLHEARPR